ncbi:MAG: peptide chain release factor N(5)-glutamine methyltransferase [Dehalococcoidales bacterium]|nr:peptide chain release factor N(5)-glutamine methyltransferase [Dehalococcoidales bacterium]
MKLKAALSRARGILAQNAIEDAPLEAELLLRHVLKINRTRLYLDLEQELSPEDEKAFGHLVERRLSGEPTAYITGRREFYGLEFYVNPHTLIPRPESELLVETALRLSQSQPVSTIADIGTGCGAIAVSLALELPRTRIYATDISLPTLEVALVNCQRHSVTDRIRLLQGDMLKPVPEPIDLIVANLPYVKESELTPQNFEPLLALDGGAEGTESIARLCRQAKSKLAGGGSMLLEIGAGQGETITGLLKSLFPDGAVEVSRDFSGIERVISLSLSRAKVAK